MDERCAQFQADAARPRDARTAKEVEKLRKFLFKNQEYRFTERAQTHLFGAVQAHISSHASLSEEEREPALLLVEDALKMPFTVFTTSHKKTFLKHLERLKPGGAGPAGAGAGAPQQQRQKWQVIDAGDSVLSVMTADGDTLDLDPGNSPADLVAKVRELFEAGSDVTVLLDEGGRGVAEVLG
ncbi:hypothetical protein HYH03_016095 [Edaphochlamys debaryana]|uniref:Translation initiation factor 5A C-terminal domain-containing protein n=1 Tax=Edaphochlamys debaryana TaxID=47281 RepID=A0A835XS99_9CHLO|nr:hypothetical protein HYH03_016095 [Edaphochlamys debaryana]|eukprot:KAG2485104.1 hypothetical protein HYH03_016095 [Edaphochlamys debaryana]